MPKSGSMTNGGVELSPLALKPMHDTNQDSVPELPIADSVRELSDSVFESSEVKNVDTLLNMIDKPKAYGLKEWTTTQKKELKESKATNAEIELEKTNIRKNLDELNTFLLNEKTAYEKLLIHEADCLDAKIKEIDDHLDQYEKKFKLYEDNDNDSEEVQEWREKASVVKEKLKANKAVLKVSLADVRKLQQELQSAIKNANSVISKQAEDARKKGPTPERNGVQSSQAINQKMSEIKDKISGMSKAIAKTLSWVKNLFQGIFESVKSLISKIAGQISATNENLKDSKSLLDGAPAPAPTFKSSH